MAGAGFSCLRAHRDFLTHRPTAGRAGLDQYLFSPFTSLVTLVAVGPVGNNPMDFGILAAPAIGRGVWRSGGSRHPHERRIGRRDVLGRARPASKSHARPRRRGL